MDFEVIASAETALGIIILQQRGVASEPGTVVTEVALEHELLMSSRVTDSERALANLAIEWHGGDDLQVFIGGLGLGYTAQAALASDRVRRAVVVELLEPVIGWMRDGLAPLSEELAPALAPGGRLEICEGDAYGQLRDTPTETYDVILIDVDHSPHKALGAPNDAFHSASGVALARQHLAPRGVLAVWSCAPSDDFVDALRSVFAEVEPRSITFFNPVIDEHETNWVFLARG